MEYLNDILIKEIVPQGDTKVFIVNNLPKNLLYHKQIKMIPRKDAEGYLTGDLVPDPTGAQEEALLDGLDKSEWDSAVVFNVKRAHVKAALDNIDRYIDRQFPRDVVPPQRVSYAAKPGDTRSVPLARNKIPVVDIPTLIADRGQVSPTSKDVPAPAVITQEDVEKAKAEAVEEYKKKALHAKLAKARAARGLKTQ